ncbi:MAG: hypothetical protein HYZ92_00555 [Candidatus Omnitrophica bacterium]|nr:hypothetical protein [Candidatus Omnitrophota bacterium]
MKQARRAVVFVLATAAGNLAAVSLALASVTLELSALRGGTVIDLGEIGPGRPTTHEELTIRIAAQPGRQYRLRQALSQPLTNERGAVLRAEQVMMELRGGQSGTTTFQGAIPMPEASELFTSDEAGRPDTLTVLYSLASTESLQAGTYTGALAYTVQTVDGSAVDMKTLPLRLVVFPASSLAPAPGSPDHLGFGALEPGQGSEARGLSLLVAGGAGGPVQLVQHVEGPLSDEQGHELPAAAIAVSLTGNAAALAEQALELTMPLWSGDDVDAAASRRLELSYRLVVPAAQPAGLYRGLIRFELEGMGGAGREAAGLEIPLELEVLPVMALIVESADHPGELVFSALAPGAISRTETLQIRVETNTGRPYEVHQELADRLISDEGRQLPDSALSCAVVADPAAVEPPAVAPMGAGKTRLYRSDERGRPGRFAVAYRLEVPADASAGVYHSRLLFTVTAF